ncbi:XdhC family protein [uncultured Shimia sp.]|uniref:XdhC family protein n=1 Tax=uncultured Shimia sp. TaxID=573152 RepID=UPI0025DFEB15|nr:XdhC family protein [uncultured Shimia sp.]
MSQVLKGAPELALEWHRAGRGAALATVVETWGSAPRRVGAQMVVSGDGQIEGSVSGGCVEGAVMVAALDAIESGKGTLLEFGVSDGDAFAVGLACGGTIKVLVEPVGTVLTEGVLSQLVEARAARIAVAYVADAKTGGGDLTKTGFEDRFRMDRSGIEDDGRFVAIHNPPLRLIVVGAVHIAQALVPMARVAGFDPVIVDPRAAFGSEARFPGETVVDEWPDEALQHIGVDARTALVLLTHDPKLDDPALHIALKSDIFYIGALGSKRTHAKRVERLQDAGYSDGAIARIYGPVGLDIGAASPSEIAVSILGEVLTVLRKGA